MPESYSPKKKNLVVGAGISGAIIARKLAEVLEDDVLVIDKAKDIGGLCVDYKDENGIMINRYGSHIFHTNYEYIWKYLNNFTKFIPFVSKNRIFVEDKEVSYPFNLNSLKEIFPKTFYNKLENKLIKRFGINKKVQLIEFKRNPFIWDKDLDYLANYIYSISMHFLQKKWGGCPYEILKEMAEKTLIHITKDNRAFEERFQGIPVSGYKKMIDNILNHKNIKVLCDMEFKDVEINGFDRIFYTGSIDEFFDYKFGILKYKSAEFDFDEFEDEKFIEPATINYPKMFDFIRIHRFKNNSNKRSYKTIISKEYLKDFACGQNLRLYPVFDNKTIKMYKMYKNEARKIKNVYFLGKLGDFRNYSMDKAIKRALEVFDSIKFEAENEKMAKKSEAEIQNIPA